MRLVYNKDAVLFHGVKEFVPPVGQEVKVGDRVRVHNQDEPMMVVQVQFPHKPESTGRVIVSPDGQSEDWRTWATYFPSVVGAEWIEREDGESVPRKSLYDDLTKMNEVVEKKGKS